MIQYIFIDSELIYANNIYLFLVFKAMEPRTLTRFDVHRYARAAYEAGVRYIGGKIISAPF